MNALDRLLAIEEIRLLKARYCRCCDSKDWDGFESLFAPDAIYDLRGADRVAGDNAAGSHFGESAYQVGAANIGARVRTVGPHFRSVHHCHTAEIDILSDIEATGIWAFEDRLVWPDGGPYRSLHGFGHYRETYEKIGGAWKIKALKVTRLRVDLT